MFSALGAASEVARAAGRGAHVMVIISVTYADGVDRIALLSGDHAVRVYNRIRPNAGRKPLEGRAPILNYL
jgi:hypothetical protein